MSARLRLSRGPGRGKRRAFVSPPGPTAGIPANSDKSRSTTRCIASGGYTVVGLSQISLVEPS